jgi:hypothetical protein
MISKSKLGAITFVAAIGLASPAFAASTGPYGPAYTGGGSAGYNHHVATDYRLKPHHVIRHAPKQQAPSDTQPH